LPIRARDGVVGAAYRGDDAAVDGRDPAGAPDGPASHRSLAERLYQALSPVLLAAVIGAVPLVVALVSLRAPRWYPVLDLAQIELRVRDVGTGDAPLLGLSGRLYGFDEQGSHPGPLSFWLLWPFYKLLGSSSWALHAATAILNVIAIGVALWLAQRRGGRAVMLGVGAALAVLAQAYGVEKLTGPWNPYMPVFWWVVFLLAVWSVLCGDLPVLVIAMFAGSLCAQTHVPYLGLVFGLLGCVSVALAVVTLRSGDARHDVRRVGRWGALSGATLVVLWLPPLIEQATHDPGNVSILMETFRHPVSEPIGLGRAAVEIWLSHLSVFELTRERAPVEPAADGAWASGLFVLGLWAAAAVDTWRRRLHEPSLWRLHLVVTAALAFGLVSLSRINGGVWDYLVLWAWGTTAMVVVATVWTAWTAATARWAAPRHRQPLGQVAAGGAVALASVVVVASAVLAGEAARAEPLQPDGSHALALLVPDTVAALGEGAAPGGGADGRYLVRWSEDVLSIGSAGFGLLLELERAGFDVGADRSMAAAVVSHRTLTHDEATATVNLVRGEEAIDRWRSDPTAIEVAFFEPRTGDEVDRYDALESQVVTTLRAAGLDDLVAAFGQNAFMTTYDERFPAELHTVVAEMLSLGMPSAVFVAPAG
jgi:hypothetical protein